MSLQLKLFGGLSLLDESGNTARVTRRHRLAVLAILAAAERPVPRERLLALVWPDSSDEAARHALGQVLYGLKQDVALGDLVTGTADLTLDRSALACDLWDFRRALAAGDRKTAVERYSGPFLDGVHLPNGDQFERWCEEERGALLRQVNEAMEALAAAATARGDAADAVNWWRRLAAGDPLSSRVALGYMRALAQAGDAATAVQLARVHAAFIRAELDADVDPAVPALAEQLRTNAAIVAPLVAPALVPPIEVTARIPATGLVENRPVAPVAVATPTVVVPTHGVPVPSAPPRSSRWRWAGGVTVAVIAAVAVMAAIVVVTQRVSPAATPTDLPGVPVAAVLPFEVRGDSTRAFLGQALSALLTGRLDAPGVLRTLESNAVLAAVGSDAKQRTDASARVAALGARVIVSGTAVVLGDGIEITAELRRAGGAPDRGIRANVSGPADSLFALADRLGATLLVAFDGRVPGNAPLGGTLSVDALKAFLSGENARRAWHLDAAETAYRAAITIDSSYALAWYRLAFVQAWGNPGNVERAAQEQTLRLVDRLPVRYALLVRAHQAENSGDIQTAERNLLTLVQRYPEDADPWSELGEYRMHIGPTIGQPTSDAEAPLTRTLVLDSIGHPEVRWHLSQLHLERGDIAGARAIFAPMLNATTEERTSRALRLMMAIATSDMGAIQPVVAMLRDGPPQLVGYNLALAIMSGGATPVALAIAESLAATHGAPMHQREGLALLMQIETARGEWSALERSGAALAALDSLTAARAWGMIAEAPDVQAPSSVWRDAGALLERAGSAPSPRVSQQMQAALAALRGHDETAFARRLQALERSSSLTPAGRIDIAALRAAHARVEGDTAAVTREMSGVVRRVDSQFARWQRAAWLESAGKYEEAERWYLSSPWGGSGIVFTRPALESAARLEMARGNKTAASQWSLRASRFINGQSIR